MTQSNEQTAALAAHDAGRRGFLKVCALATVALIAQPAWAKSHPVQEKQLAFFNTHTGEKINAVYWAEGRYVTDGLAEISRILRDHRTGDVRPMDPRLLDLLYDLHDLTDARRPFHVISGYRSPATNRMLHTASNGVAERSLHLVGQAIDIRLPGCRLANLRRAAVYLGRGGVGYYPESDFVHVDTGRVRYW